jgi:hypothetical protein
MKEMCFSEKLGSTNVQDYTASNPKDQNPYSQRRENSISPSIYILPLMWEAKCHTHKEKKTGEGVHFKTQPDFIKHCIFFRWDSFLSD